MKKLILLFIILFVNFKPCLTHGNTFSKDTNDSIKYKNYIKIAPIGLIGLSLTFTYERKISKWNSFELALGYKHNNNRLGLDFYSDNLDAKEKIKGFMTIMAFRHYFEIRKKHLYYFSPFFRYCYLDEHTYNVRSGNVEDKSYINSLAVGVTFGRQLFSRRITTDIFIGPQIKFIDGLPSEEVVIPWENRDQTEGDLGHQLYLGVRLGVNIAFGF